MQKKPDLSEEQGKMQKIADNVKNIQSDANRLGFPANAFPGQVVGVVQSMIGIVLSNNKAREDLKAVKLEQNAIQEALCSNMGEAAPDNSDIS